MYYSVRNRHTSSTGFYTDDNHNQPSSSNLYQPLAQQSAHYVPSAQSSNLGHYPPAQQSAQFVPPAQSSVPGHQTFHNKNIYFSKPGWQERNLPTPDNIKNINNHNNTVYSNNNTSAAMNNAFNNSYSNAYHSRMNNGYNPRLPPPQFSNSG